MNWELTQSLGLVAHRRYCDAESNEGRKMGGYFGIGVERLSKPMNAGILFRSAQAFGAGFLLTVRGSYSKNKAYSDTSQSTNQLPFLNTTRPSN